MAGTKRLHLVLLAGGSGSRAARGRGAPPKQFCLTGRGPLFTVSLRAFLGLDPGSGFQVAGVTVAVPEAWRENAVRGLGEVFDSPDSLPWQLAPAGQTRTASTWNALQVLATGYGSDQDALPPGAGDLVAVHDAARPFVTTDLLARLATAAGAAGGAVPGLPVPDTIVQTADPSDPAAPATYLERLPRSFAGTFCTRPTPPPPPKAWISPTTGGCWPVAAGNRSWCPGRRPTGR